MPSRAKPIIIVYSPILLILLILWPISHPFGERILFAFAQLLWSSPVAMFVIQSQSQLRAALVGLTGVGDYLTMIFSKT